MPKRVLITGANRGIGREMARQMAARGAHVIVAARSADAANETADALRQAGGAADALELDVTNSPSITAAARTFAERFGRLDVLINNAGIYPDEGLTILTIPRPLLAQTLETNTFGPIEVVQAFLPALRQSDAGRLINVSSGYGQLSDLSPDVPSYCLSKLALNGATIMLAAALSADGIAVNSLCPVWGRTVWGGSNAPRSVEEGADTGVWLTLDAAQSLTRRFFRDRSEIPW